MSKLSQITGASRLRMLLLTGAAALMLSPVVATAFTLEGDAPASGSKWGPKFDIEEQARNFSSSTSTTTMSSTTQRRFDGSDSKLQFGVQGGNTQFSPGTSAIENRRHFDRMLSPEYQFAR